MKAVVYTEYGSPDVLHIQEVEKPTIKENEILVRNHASSVNYGDLIGRDFKNLSPRQFNMPFLFYLIARFQFGLNTPRNPILGSEFAGEVEAVGPAVTRFKVGDQVFGHRGQSMQAYAEYLTMPEDGDVALKPANMRYEEAAVVPYGAITAYNLLKKANLKIGQKILIIGASGSIGSAAVQIAKHYGAEVTGVCSTPRVEFVKSLGADKVIDYTREDYTRSGERYDLILDVLGRGSFSQSKSSLKSGGRYMFASFKGKQLLQMLWTSIAGGKKVICALSPEKSGALESVRELVEAGKLRAALDQCFPMEQTAEAHRYVEEGHKKGGVAVLMRD